MLRVPEAYVVPALKTCTFIWVVSASKELGYKACETKAKHMYVAMVTFRSSLTSREYGGIGTVRGWAAYLMVGHGLARFCFCSWLVEEYGNLPFPWSWLCRMAD